WLFNWWNKLHRYAPKVKKNAPPSSRAFTITENKRGYPPLLFQVQPDRQGVGHPHGPAILNARRPFAAALQYADGRFTCAISQIADKFQIRKATVAFYHERNLHLSVHTRFYRLLRKIVISTNIFHKCTHPTRWLRLNLNRLEQPVVCVRFRHFPGCSQLPWRIQSFHPARVVVVAGQRKSKHTRNQRQQQHVTPAVYPGRLITKQHSYPPLQ